MAGAKVTLAGFPVVIRCTLFQGTTQEAGSCICDCLVASSLADGDVTNLPKTTSLKILARSFEGDWGNMKITKARVRNGRMRVVLKDSRWVLNTVTMPSNFNDRDASGAVKTGTQKTITELIAEIASVSGLTISINVSDGATIPSFYPPARWSGKTAEYALKNLLYWTGMRMVYNPVDETYWVSSAGTGYLPPWNGRIYRPGPPARYNQVKVASSPVLYEDRLDASAKQISLTTGDTEALSLTNLPTSAGQDYGQLAWRLWEPDAVTHPAATPLSDTLFVAHRAKSVTNDPTKPLYESCRVIPDDWEQYPHHQLINRGGVKVTQTIETTGGGRGFITEHPVMIRDSGGSTLSKTAKLLVSYYRKVGGALVRSTMSSMTGGTGTEALEITADWIKPINSTESDVPADKWNALLQDVANAIVDFYSGDASNVKLSNPEDVKGSARIGGLHYELSQTRYKTKVLFAVAFNFTPGSAGGIR